MLQPPSRATAAEADRLRISGNGGHPNLPADRGAPVVVLAVVAEFTLLLRENGDAHEPGRFCGHGCALTRMPPPPPRSCSHGLGLGAGGNGGIGSSFPPAKRRSAGATSSAAAFALAKSNSGSGSRDDDTSSDASDRRGGAAKLARSWENEILGLTSSGASSIGGAWIVSGRDYERGQ